MVKCCFFLFRRECEGTMILHQKSLRFPLAILIILGFFTNQRGAQAANLSSTSVATNSFNSNITTTTVQPTGSVNSQGSSSSSVGSGGSTATTVGSGGSTGMTAGSSGLIGTSGGSGSSTVTPVGSGGSTGTTAGSSGLIDTSGGSGGSISTAANSGGSTGTVSGSGGSTGTLASSGYATAATVGSGSNAGPTVVSGASSGSGNSITTTSSKALIGAATNQQSTSAIQNTINLNATVKPLKVVPDFVENSLTIAKTYYAEITFPAFLGLMIFIIAFMTVTAGKAACLIKPCTKGQVDEDYKKL